IPPRGSGGGSVGSATARNRARRRRRGSWLPSGKRSCPCPYRRRLPRAWQADCELGELAKRAVDGDRAAVLLGDNVIADRQPEAGAFPGRLGGEERLE